MIPYRLAFDSPWYLALLVLVPLLWWTGRRSLAGLGRFRRIAAMLIRSVVLVLFVMSLAEIQWVRRSQRLTAIYLLDQSFSIPEAQRRAMVVYVNRSIERFRDPMREDRAGVVVFGRDAAVEIPPIDENVPLPMAIESLVDREHTDLAGALKMARALFPHDTAKRIVLVSDGNENLGDALRQARSLAEAGIGLDVVPIALPVRGEVAVEKIAVSSDVRRGQPFELRVVMSNTARDGDPEGVARGRLKLIRRVGQREETLADQPIELPPGKKVLSVSETIDQPDFYSYEARFIPSDPAADAVPQNNRATTFTHVRGRGHVLLIEDWENRGEFDPLVERLRRENVEVTVQPSNRLFTSLAELQRYDTVVLANVPRSSGDEADDVTSFSDAQIAMLARNTQQMGSGLVMLGGPNSFGAGGWTNTELEKVMPVDFQIKSAKVEAVGALALVMHAGEMPRGNYWQKVVAREAIKALGPHDYCGLVHWNGRDAWLWGGSQGIIRVGPSRKQMLGRLDRMTPGDMPQFDGSMMMAAASFATLKNAAVKHMIIISDGDPSPPSNATIQRLKTLGVKVSTVAVGSHGTLGSALMQRIARATGGKYYVVKKETALPRIYQREARRIARPLVFEDKAGVVPRVKFPHEMIKGVDAPFPPITGFVMTTLKESPLVEVALVSPRPVGEKNATVLAAWTYGLGKAVALTTDAGRRWASSWTAWEQYDKLFSQIIRWSMRPVGEPDKFSIATDLQDGQGRIVVTALDQDDAFLHLSGAVVGPDMNTLDVTFRQTAAGRYEGTFDAASAGNYLLLVHPGTGRAPIRAGVSVPYSDEFRRQDVNLPLLESVAELSPPGGSPGQLDGAIESTPNSAPISLNPFRHDLPLATASTDIWHLLVFAGGCLFFVDVLNRRVQFSAAWLPPLLARAGRFVLRRESAPVATQTMQRLQRRKAQVDDELARKQAAARFEPQAGLSAKPKPSAEGDAATGDAPTAAVPQPPDRNVAPEETYTDRLLRAKRDVWKRRGKGP